MYHIIINPASRSGRGAQYWNLLRPYLEEKSISFTAHISEYSGHIPHISAELTKDLSDHSPILSMIVLGGDGTVNEVLQGISRFDKVRLSYIPTGSSNDLARALKLSKNPLKAMERLLQNPTLRRMDIGCVEYKDYQKADPVFQKRYFAVSCGIGYDAAICQEAMYSKIKQILNRCGIGKLTYLMIALKQLLRTKPLSAKLDIPGEETIRLRNLLFLVGMIQPFEGGGFMFAPDADVRDGILDLCCVANVTKLKVLLVLPRAYKGTHFRHKGAAAYRAASYTLKTASPMWLHTDGEVPAITDHIRVSCFKEAIEIAF